MISWVNINSGEIRKIGYDVTTGRMYVDFEEGDNCCSYNHVPEFEFRNFVNAKSVGQYFDRYIKDYYEG